MTDPHLDILARFFPPKRVASPDVTALPAGVLQKRKKGSSTASTCASSEHSELLDFDGDEELEGDLLPPDLDFMGVTSKEKGKRRTDRCGSSESSDSGVATLSPSTTSPYSPCCDLSSDSSSSSSGHCSPSSPESSSPPPPTLHPVKPSPSVLNTKTKELIERMTAVSAVLAAEKRPPFLPSQTTPTKTPNNNNNNNNAFNCDQKTSSTVTNPTNSSSQNNPPNNNSVNNRTAGKGILAVALSFTQQQEKQKQLALLTKEKEIKYEEGDLNKKPRFGGVAKLKTTPSSPPSPTKVVKVKRKFAENEERDSKSSSSSSSAPPSPVGGSVVQGGRVCSVQESLEVSAGKIPDAHFCGWKGCGLEVGGELLEHIQSVHVGGQQIKGTESRYVCLWEGCKVYGKKSSSLSWLERHVLSHGGNKPFKCIFPGCGQSFGVQGALERHVNSHMSTSSGCGTFGAFGPNRKMESSPFKGPRRKKQQRCKKQRLNIGQFVDFFDKRVMEVIKHRLATSVNWHTVSPHCCTFKGHVLAKRVPQGKEPQVLVQWFPRSVIPDEWIDLSSYNSEKEVPLSQIPRHKLYHLFPTLFPSRKHSLKGRRKWSVSSYSSSSCCSTRSSSNSSISGYSGTSTATPNTPTSPPSGDEDEEDDDEEDWGVNLFLQSLSPPSSS